MSGARIRLAVAALGCALAPHLAHAQTVGGEIVGLQSGKPVHGANVALVDDSAKIVSSAVADTANGMFYVDAPHAGHYRVVLFVPGGSFVSPAMQLDSGQTLERKFSVPEIPGDFRGAYFAQDVTTPAQLVRFRPPPVYPEAERATNTSGYVIAMFVVDDHGQPDPKTLQVVNDAGYDFAQAVRGSIANAIYMPATKDGVSVRQVVQLSIAFGAKDKAPNADVMVTALGIGRPRSSTAGDTTAVMSSGRRHP